MTPGAEGLLPADVAAELLRRWREPHRHYHGTSHLVAGLAVLEQLGAGRLERIAYWAHDAVHTNTTPDDEEASAELAGELLAPHLPRDEVAEVQRLILLTRHHRASPGDAPGQRLCDADLAGLGLPWEEYLANVAGIRAELPEVDDAEWRTGRAAVLRRFLERPTIYATAPARELWEQQARDNLARELAALTAG